MSQYAYGTTAPSLSFMVMSPYAVTKSPSAMTLWTVNWGASMGPMDAIHWRMASLPCTVVSPTMVHATSSAQNARNPSVLPSANAALTFSTMALLLTDMGIAPLFSWRLEPSDCSGGLPHAAESRRTTHITASRQTLGSPLDGILGSGATPTGDRPLERPPLLGAFSLLWENQALGLHRPFAVVTPGIPSWGRKGACSVHPAAGGARIGGLLRRQGGVGDSDLAHGASLAMQYGTEFVHQGP